MFLVALLIALACMTVGWLLVKLLSLIVPREPVDAEAFIASGDIEDLIRRAQR
ncbi:MAG: hypothetical protein H0W81_06435 [Chloroflexi bacterium]|nr:hypothetical protein [Chloroflexota bacterium]